MTGLSHIADATNKGQTLPPPLKLTTWPTSKHLLWCPCYFLQLLVTYCFCILLVILMGVAHVTCPSQVPAGEMGQARRLRCGQREGRASAPLWRWHKWVCNCTKCCNSCDSALCYQYSLHNTFVLKCVWINGLQIVIYVHLVMCNMDLYI